MRNSRRMVYLATALAVASFAVGSMGEARAQPYPSKPIHIVVPYAAASTTDILGRMIAEYLTESLRQPVVVENRPGASGVTGSGVVSRSAPDGYTLVLGTAASHLVSAILLSPPPYDPLKDFAPISLVTKYPNAIVVHPSLGLQSARQLLDYLKKNPGTPYGASGPTTAGRFTAELMQSQLGLKMTIVPYNGAAPAINDLLGGHLKLAIVDIFPVTPHLNSGKLKLLAVTSRTRSPVAPDVPTLEEAGINNFESVAWVSMFAPVGTPSAILQRLSSELRRGLNRPEVKAKLENAGAILVTSTPEELTQYLTSELRTLGRVAKENNVKAQ